MELCSSDLGKELEIEMKSNRTIPTEAIMELMRQLKRALKFLFDQSQIHRDIKPSNIMMQIPNRPENPASGGPWGSLIVYKLGDFGLVT